MSLLKRLFGLGGPSVDLVQKIREGASIIDVRSPEEYRSGHVKGSVNIPLDKLPGQLEKINKNKPVITCCRSGARSGMASDLLERNGFESYNGGPWTTVRGLKG